MKSQPAGSATRPDNPDRALGRALTDEGPELTGGRPCGGGEGGGHTSGAQRRAGTAKSPFNFVHQD